MTNSGAQPVPAPISALVASLQERLDRLPPRLAHQRAFLSTYQRTSSAVGEAIERRFFEDNAWVEAWEVTFAGAYLTALDAELTGGVVPGPWARAFAASPALPPLRHALLGINAHVNFDLPQTLLAMISDAEFGDLAVMELRRRDHERIDGILADRVAAEGDELTTPSARTRIDRLLAPINRWGSRRLLREARHKCWLNTLELHAAKTTGPAEYAERRRELELLCEAKIAEILGPRQVLLHLAISGFGVTLAPRSG